MKSKIQRTDTRKMSREDWLQERRKSLGGSDMGAVLGLNPWRGPYAVWAEKTGKIADEEDNEAMRIGRDLEHYVAQRFCEASGYKLARVNAILRNPELPHIHASVDRVSNVPGQSFGVECKTASALSQSRYAGGEFPESYYAQCVTYLAVTEFDRWYLAVLVMGKEFKIFQMTRIENDGCPVWCESSVYVSDGEIAALKDAAAEFWGYVERDEAPPVDGTKATKDALGEVFAAEKEQTLDLSWPSVLAAIRSYLKLKEEEKERKLLLDEQANIIKEFLGEATGGVCELAKVSWKSQTRESFDRKRFEKDHPDIDIGKYVKTSCGRVLRVTAAN